MRLARSACVVVAVTVTGCAGTLPPAPVPTAKIDDTQIVPYSRIGKFALGMTEKQLFEWAGEPEETHCMGGGKRGDGTSACGGDNFYYYEGRTLVIGFEKGRAFYVLTTSSRYATADGIAVGASDLRLRAAWGSPTKTRDLGPCGDTCDTIKVQTQDLCFGNGMSVELDAQSKRVSRLGVRSSGCNLP